MAIVQRERGKRVQTRGQMTWLIAALAYVGLQDVHRLQGDLMGISVFQKIAAIAKYITPGAL